MNGTVMINADGTISYTPNPDFNGTDTITYEVSDGNGSTATTTATIVVTSVNDAPVAQVDGPVITAPNTEATGNVLTNDSDADGDLLTVTEFSIDTNGDGTPDVIPVPVDGSGTATLTDTAGIPIGTLVIGSDGTYTFTPADSYDGPVPVATYTVSDGTNTDSATLTFADVPNTDPVAGNDGPVITAPNTPATGNVLTNDTDADGDTLSVTEFSIDTDGDGTPDVIPVPVDGSGTATLIDIAGIPIGTLVIGSDGTYTFTPADSYGGPVPVATYTVSDGTSTDSATLSFAAVPSTPQVEAVVSVPEAPTPAPAPIAQVETQNHEQPKLPITSPTRIVPLPVATVPSLHVVFAVGNSRLESSLRSSPLGAHQISGPTLAEASNVLPDGVMLQFDDSRSPALLGELARGQVMTFDPALHVQHAVRYEAVTPEPGLYVQTVVRGSQAEAGARGAMLDAHQSATPGYDTLLDPFALGSPALAAMVEAGFVADAGGLGKGERVATQQQADAADSLVQVPANQPSETPTPAQLPVDVSREAVERLLEKLSELRLMENEPVIDRNAMEPAPGVAGTKPAMGESFHAQLQRQSDHKMGTRPLTRAASAH